jgi:hypothetical protein
MSRKTGQPTITIQLSDEQHAALKALTADEPMNAYIRRLIAQDAKQRKLPWPDNLRKWKKTTEP